MGNNMTLCSCSDNLKATEHTIPDFNRNMNQYDKNSDISSDDLMAKKSKAGMVVGLGSMGVSDIDTGDFQQEVSKFDSFQTNISTIKINEELTYIGPIVNGKKSGKGIIKNKTGQLVYEGFFKDDLYEGEGTLILENGLIFNGIFKKGKKNGKGLIFSTLDKFRYDGEWKDDLKSGQGTETYPDGSSYVGAFENNKKNGKGIYYMNDGSVYDGDFKDDRIEGEGKFTWTDDKIYIGEWKNNSLNGFGVFFKKGKVYIGNFFNDTKHGTGLYLLTNGNILIGNFEKGEIEGLAVVLPNEGPDHLCFMTKSKPNLVITDINEKNNIKLSLEYKTLITFYEKNKERLSNFLNSNQNMDNCM